jgi:hypothetical protein
VWSTQCDRRLHHAVERAEISGLVHADGGRLEADHLHVRRGAATCIASTNQRALLRQDFRRRDHTLTDGRIIEVHAELLARLYDVAEPRQARDTCSTSSTASTGAGARVDGCGRARQCVAHRTTALRAGAVQLGEPIGSLSGYPAQVGSSMRAAAVGADVPAEVDDVRTVRSTSTRQLRRG